MQKKSILSVNQLKKTLFEIGLKENEFIVRPQESGQQNLCRQRLIICLWISLNLVWIKKKMNG